MKQDNNPQPNPQAVAKSPQTPESTQHLVRCIKGGDILGLQQNLGLYKSNGSVVMGRVLHIPFESRIPSLLERNSLQKVHGLVTVMLTKFCQEFNVVRNMTDSQIVQCGLKIIESSHEDQLSLEDLMLFFDGATAGKYGRVLDHLDSQVIFEMLEKYRDERHKTFVSLRDEQEIAYKSCGDSPRMSDEANPIIRAAELEFLKQNYKPHGKATDTSESF